MVKRTRKLPKHEPDRGWSFDSESSGLRPAYSSLRTFDVKVARRESNGGPDRDRPRGVTEPGRDTIDRPNVREVVDLKSAS